MSLPFALKRPPEFMVERATKFIGRGTAMEKFEVKDVEFEKDRLEVVRLIVNPY